MTLDGYALTGLFVVIFGFLCVTAYIFERAEPDPISGDRRHQAHPLRSPEGRSSTAFATPRSGAAGMDRPSGDPRGSLVSPGD